MELDRKPSSKTVLVICVLDHLLLAELSSELGNVSDFDVCAEETV